jgi:hypothetical protein
MAAPWQESMRRAARAIRPWKRDARGSRRTGQGAVMPDLPSTCRSFRGLSWWPVQRGNGSLQERPIPGSVSVEVQVPLQIGSFPQVLFCHPDSRPCTKSHPGFLPGRSIRGNQEGYRRVMCGGLPCATGCLGSVSGSGRSRDARGSRWSCRCLSPLLLHEAVDHAL